MVLYFPPLAQRRLEHGIPSSTNLCGGDACRLRGGGGSSASAPAPAPEVAPEPTTPLTPAQRFDVAAERMMSYAGGNTVRNGIQIFQNAGGTIEALGNDGIRWNENTRQFATANPAEFARRPISTLRGTWSGVALAKFSSEYGVTSHIGDVTLTYDGRRPDTTEIRIVMDADPLDVAYRTIEARMPVATTGGFFHDFGRGQGIISGAFGGTDGREAGGRFRRQFYILHKDVTREWDGGFGAVYQGGAVAGSRTTDPDRTGNNTIEN